MLGQCTIKTRKTDIKGYIQIPESVRCRCGVPEGLCVSLFQISIGSVKHLKTLPVGDDSSFEDSIALTAKGAAQIEAILHDCKDTNPVFFTRVGSTPVPVPPAAKGAEKMRVVRPSNPQKIDLEALPSQVVCDVFDEAIFNLNYPDPYEIN